MKLKNEFEDFADGDITVEELFQAAFKAHPDKRDRLWKILNNMRDGLMAVEQTAATQLEKLDKE